MGEYAEPRDGPAVVALAALADELGISVTAGYSEWEGSHIYDAAVLAQPGGRRGHYRNCHLFSPGERAASRTSRRRRDLVEVPCPLLKRLTNLACCAA